MYDGRKWFNRYSIEQLRRMDGIAEVARAYEAGELYPPRITLEYDDRPPKSPTHERQASGPKPLPIQRGDINDGGVFIIYRRDREGG